MYGWACLYGFNYHRSILPHGWSILPQGWGKMDLGLKKVNKFLCPLNHLRIFKCIGHLELICVNVKQHRKKIQIFVGTNTNMNQSPKKVRITPVYYNNSRNLRF